LVVRNGALVLLLLILKRGLKIIDNLQVFLDLAAQSCRINRATVPGAGADGTAKDVDVDVLCARGVVVGGARQTVEGRAELAAAKLRGVKSIGPSKAAVGGRKGHYAGILVIETEAETRSVRRRWAQKRGTNLWGRRDGSKPAGKQCIVE
jgi:hypothetical protein